MQNDPELNPKFLGQISSDFIKVSDNLQEASYQIRKRGFSKHPIFPVSKEAIPIGSLLYEAGRFENHWNYYASFLEEFQQRQLIEQEDDFKASYKDPDEFCCLFIVDAEFTNFVYVPYPID
ncbi:MAG: hypothetical protein KI790_04735 [Cyclobacteriaceae bacterium]|nr:hypothetical protein [Cyclobacteriaceae bacterium HetDA_MAG_MS6]